jgi:hypothetical protein
MKSKAKTSTSSIRRISQLLAAALLLTAWWLPARADAERNDDHRRSSKPVTQQQPGPRRTLDVPRRLTAILKDLKVGQLWVAQGVGADRADRPMAIRASLESEGRIAASLTLNPTDGKPVLYSERANFRPNAIPAENTLNSYLRDLRSSAQGVKFGAYVLPSPRGLEVQVYWGGKLVSYLYLDPSNGQTIVDDTSAREIANSPLRLK